MGLASIAVGCGAPPPPIAAAPEAPPPAVAPVPFASDRPAPIAAPAVASAPAPASPPAPADAVAVGLPYALGEGARESGAGVAELAELARWNHGGRGEGAPELPAPTGHPLPRVRVDVVAVRGPHAPRAIERVARAALWAKLIECYRPGAQRDGALRGKVTVVAKATRAGKLAAPRLASVTLRDPEVVRCFVARVAGLDVPPARAASTVTLSLQIAPGDEPLPPAADLILPGSGRLDPELARAAFAAAEPALVACFAASRAEDPGLWGRIAVRVHVAADGRVDEAFEAESRFPDPRVTACVLRAARGLVLPSPIGGDLRAIVPLRFGAPPRAD